MGKGKNVSCGARTAYATGDPVESDHSLDGLPGRSARARHTFALLDAADTFKREYLLRDLSAPSKSLADDQADAPTMVHNALMRWIPSSYSGHPRYNPEHEIRRRELYFCLLLDGDRRADHTYFYTDPVAGSEWTLAAGAAVRGWYGLPHDDQGHLLSEGLPDALRDAMDVSAPLLSALRHEPLRTLANCIDLPEPLPDLYAELPDVVFPERLNRLGWLRVRDAGALAREAGLKDRERRLLEIAAVYAPGFSVDPAAAAQQARAGLGEDGEAVGALIEELQVHRSPEGLPVLAPRTRLGALLADAQQSWMASPWCDEALAAWRAAEGRDDDLQMLLVAKDLCARTPWHSTVGRARFAGPARRQETRLRSLHALATGIPVPKAPKNQRRLRAA